MTVNFCVLWKRLCFPNVFIASCLLLDFDQGSIALNTVLCLHIYVELILDSYAVVILEIYIVFTLNANVDSKLCNWLLAPPVNPLLYFRAYSASTHTHTRVLCTAVHFNEWQSISFKLVVYFSKINSRLVYDVSDASSQNLSKLVRKSFSRCSRHEAENVFHTSAISY